MSNNKVIANLCNMKKILNLGIFLSIFSIACMGQTTGKLTVSFTTKTYNGSYAPKHILAVWVVNSSGSFVKTLMSYYSNTKYVPYLTNWKSATTSSYNRTDAITGATQSSHAVRTCYWNGQNASGVLQADGTYTVWVEFTESNTTGKYTSFTITKGSQTVSVTPSATSYISGITATWVPETTGTENPEYEAARIYPNPVISILYAEGNSVNNVEIYSVTGQKLGTYNSSVINVSALESGEYFAKIHSADGTVVKKFIKL